MRHIFSAALALLVCLLVPASGQQSNPNGDVVRVVMNYSLFPEYNVTELPSVEAIDGVLCQTNYFISQMYQEVTGNPAYRVTAVQIDPSLNPDESLPIRLEFSLNVTTADDSEIVPIADQVSLFNSANFNETVYILQYVYNSDPKLPWENVNRMNYRAIQSPPVVGEIPAAQCPETIAPTTSPTTAAEFVEANTTTAPLSVSDGNLTDDDALTPEGNITDNGLGTEPTAPVDAGNGTDNQVGPIGNETGPPTVGPGTGNETGPTEGPGGPAGIERPEFTFHFGFNPPKDGGDLQEPTETEMFELICQLNRFTIMQLNKVLGLNDTHYTSLNVDWAWNPAVQQPLQLNFTSNATDAEGNIIPADDIKTAMDLSVDDVQGFIKNYAWTIGNETGVFYDVKDLNFTAVSGVDNPRGPGRYPEVGCPETPAPSMMPSSSPNPTSSPAPSNLPTTSPAPTASDKPSIAPSAPTTVAPTAPSGPTPAGNIFNVTKPTPPPAPTVSPAPTSSRPPSSAPSVSPAPTASAAPTSVAGPGGGPLGPGVPLPMNASFIVSNTALLTKPEQILDAGLTESWPVFVQEFVANQTASSNRRLRAGRRLEVAVSPNTAVITDVSQRVDCGPGAVVNLACFMAQAKYDLIVYGEDPEVVNQTYAKEMDVKIYDGTYQSVMEEVSPDTPLYIGVLLANETSAPTTEAQSSPAPVASPTAGGGAPTAAPGNSNRDVPPAQSGGVPLWLIILLIVLGVLLCCCCLALLAMFLMARKKQDKNLDPYDEEKFVYEWLLPEGEKLQTEVDDATRDVDDEDERDEIEGDGADDEAAPVVTIMEDEFEDDDEEDEARGGDHETAETEENDDGAWDSDEDKPDPEAGHQDDPDGVRVSEKEKADEEWDDEEDGGVVAGDDAAEQETSEQGEKAGDDDDDEKWDDDEPGETFEEGDPPRKSIKDKADEGSDGEDWEDE